MTDCVGLKRRIVKLVDYNPEWVGAFEAEKQNLLATLEDFLKDIEHVGSTSIPELKAKPIIDMLAVVDDLSVYQQLIKPLTKMGYEYMPEQVFEDRVFFPKGPRNNRTHHLNLVTKNSKQWTELRLFRDYLTKNKVARMKYQKLKVALAKKYPNDRLSYTKAKEQLIQKILEEASHSKQA